MTGSWRLALTSVTALAICALSAQAEIQFGSSVLTVLSGAEVQDPKKDQKKTPKKEPKKKEPKKEAKKDPKKDATKGPATAAPAPHVYHGPVRYGPAEFYANAYWPGPVLPGMWGTRWGGIWPYSWWMGGPWMNQGGNDCGGGGGCCWSGGGATRLILPPVFSPTGYPAVSPYWRPYYAPTWVAPAPAAPAIIGKADRERRHEVRQVPVAAPAEKLYATGLWLYFDDNFRSAREHLAAAVAKDPHDARVWYFKALAERGAGDESAAQKSAGIGAALEIVGATDKKAIGLALERIQGQDRAFLHAYVSGVKALDAQQAAAIVAQLKATDPSTIASSR